MNNSRPIPIQQSNKINEKQKEDAMPDETDLYWSIGSMANAFERRDRGPSWDGNQGASFPQSDVDDFRAGARFIPSEVTLLRRKGKKVDFVRECSNSCCWYWELPESKRIWHFGSAGALLAIEKNGGSCAHCGNTHSTGSGHCSPTCSDEHHNYHPGV
ncbi:MAG: hypothetical protein A2119_01250 [Candidatus Colwellbacteria bacterium GWA2_46_10]|uniref:Uncharacterized protein n=1 Tax=Candidatus Colwellbacteria bacterium GWA2_46_10 TaxID=1797684 RepID=A0A1G1YX83_9BACT|nr:MAG: hypothetical protein UX29_C0011G0021 [Parcubacteria group bacterium GW2011_GWA2_46_10]OGY56991.1 MAG: hypothetical protein A2119_01250 [Candidatus Colwellbacteria bacterium GWA2_46_10]